MASTVGIGVHRGGDAEGVGLGNRFAQEVDQRVVDARVLDASGSEKKPHDASASLLRGAGRERVGASIRRAARRANK